MYEVAHHCIVRMILLKMVLEVTLIYFLKEFFSNELSQIFILGLTHDVNHKDEHSRINGPLPQS